MVPSAPADGRWDAPQARFQSPALIAGDIHRAICRRPTPAAL